MTKLFKKLPGFRETPPGLERDVLRRLPRLLLFGTVLPALLSLLARVFPWSGGAANELAAQITTFDIYAISVVILHWTVVLTVAIMACIVMVMKGPAYVADAYPLEDAEHPDTSASRQP